MPLNSRSYLGTERGSLEETHLSVDSELTMAPEGFRHCGMYEEFPKLKEHVATKLVPTYTPACFLLTSNLKSMSEWLLMLFLCALQHPETAKENKT